MKEARPRIVAAALLLAAACVPALPQAGAPRPAAAARVTLTLTVTDQHGRYVTNVGKEALTVLDEKAAAELASFEPETRPSGVGVVFDLTADNRAALLASARAAVSDFVASGGEDDRYFVIGFDKEAYLAADWVKTPAEAAAGFDRLAGVKPSNKPALHDALAAALAKVGGGPHQRRALILISDGRNDGSKLKREELFEALRRSDALVYAVAVMPPHDSPFGSPDAALLQKLCAMSGGFFMSARTAVEFRTFFERLSVELKNQYVVSFAPADAGPAGGWRRLSFKVKPLELKKPPSDEVVRLRLSARGREGYYHRR